MACNPIGIVIEKFNNLFEQPNLQTTFSSLDGFERKDDVNENSSWSWSS